MPNESNLLFRFLAAAHGVRLPGGCDRCVGEMTSPKRAGRHVHGLGHPQARLPRSGEAVAASA